MSTDTLDLAGLLGQSPVGPPSGGRHLRRGTAEAQPKESCINMFAGQGKTRIMLQPRLEELIGPRRFGVSDLSRQAESNLLFLQEKLARAPGQIADAVLIDSTVMHGNPVFRGTRIPLYQIVEELADGTTFEELAEGYPSLEPERICLALDFAASLLRIYDEKLSDR